VKSVLTQPRLAEELRERGHARASAYRWSSVGEHVSLIYDDVRRLARPT
jgi:hypothetical protein